MYISEVINRALGETMASLPNVYLIGEDIEDPYGGTFRVTQNLSTQFKGRVINTPISEAALIGISTGMAIRGLRPVLEIMFGDFITLGMDQLVNHTAKFRFMYNGQVRVPLFIRVPMGGRRGYGPTHSQTLEKLLLGIPGIKVIAASQKHPIHSMYIHAITTEECPVVLIENKALYSTGLDVVEQGRCGDFFVRQTTDVYPCLSLSLNKFEEAQGTVVTYGGMLPFVEKAVTRLFLEEEIALEILVPSLLGVPLKVDWLADSLSKTGQLFIVEEGSKSLGFGAELAARVCEEYFELLRYPVARIAAQDCPIPCARHLEDLVLPNESSIYEALRRGLHHG